MIFSGYIRRFEETAHGMVKFSLISDTPERAVWLTIDDGPDAESTPKILDLLAKHDAKAAFFVIGKKVEQDPDALPPDHF